jgi:ABC-2 type transport system permease protein
MSAFADLTYQNPILLEYKRVLGKFLRPSPNQLLNHVSLWMVALFYGYFLYLNIRYEVLRPSDTAFVELLLYSLLVPAFVHGTIATEREKRTWDLLLVAPVSKQQLVFGKYLATGLIVVALSLALSPFMVISYAHSGNINDTILSCLLLKLVALLFGFTLNAIGIAVSAMTKRGLLAHGLIHCMQALWLLIVPLGYAAATQVDGPWHGFLSPYYILTNFANGNNRVSFSVVYVAYTSVIILSLFLANRQVRKVDEV